MAIAVSRYSGVSSGFPHEVATVSHIGACQILKEEIKGKQRMGLERGADNS